MSSALSLDTVTLDWLKVAVQNAVTPEFAESVRADVRQEVWGHLVLQLRAQILTERLPEQTVREAKTFTFEVPASPWQQFKDQHAKDFWLRWLVRRRPVRMVTHTRRAEIEVDISRFWSYPEARVSAQMGRPVRVMVLDRSVDWIADFPTASSALPDDAPQPPAPTGG